MFTENDRGQVGIGTLIVFIAMVLVAAIAAGVLINTAGMLQSSAEQTGEDATSEVTDNLKIASVTAVDVNDEAIEAIDILVSPSAGADSIDLEDATIQLEVGTEDGVTTDTLTAEGAFLDGSRADGDDNNEFSLDGDFGVAAGGSSTLSDQSDRAIIQIDFSQLTGIDGGATPPEGLAPRETVSITIATASGGQAFTQKTAPQYFESGDEFVL